ncbi:MAG: acetyl-CoA carboxylase, carboxyltransferase subunit beta [Candidatus Omnitrophica bacterium]|nr:acetyl-CoA carboxylase, carboxyltransferase subunit beta [Candidatus Omnitrophota bacterium]MBU2045042.1 acetyl-CoA carboxylase, carboxyltransferase subunit beta [Candidatus Omnitrophota bacterium]MBU2251294.1 acetyl-CoA carboxylase, carboxyltransferase subunit beta [Candidatus Omnitrophota bacterium]MBU2474262.1 acetyl-CoA carboxylase, carboxyltransferase subunit beta [Candidatus Omnitrophota bacterium]
MKIFKKPFGGLRKQKKNIPDGLWSKCPSCSQLIFNKILGDNLKVCPKCNYHFLLTCWERVDLLADADSFSEIASELNSLDPLEFSGPKTYKEKLEQAVEETGLKEAAVVGEAKINGSSVALGVTDSRFIMGSMGSVVGEKITRLAEIALEKHIPLMVVSGSGGGARMYEGMFSLMQMAKTSGILAKLKEENIVFISILTNPTMAGVMASFAGLGDVTIAEPGALIGFTGPRVIKQTIKQDLPKGFQTSEFNLKHGLIDMVIHRKDLKNALVKLIYYLS